MRGWENSRQLCQPSPFSRVCITVLNSPNPSRVYIRLCKHRKRFLLLKYPFTCTQGPALYAYNNSKFTEEDWKGIRLVCDSIKVEDTMKVGRFGLGFKSVFHMTGKAKYHQSTCKPKTKIIFWRFFISYVTTNHPPHQRCEKRFRRKRDEIKLS